MRRRDLIALIGSAVVAWPLVAHPQQTQQIPKIGLLDYAPFWTPLQEALPPFGVFYRVLFRHSLGVGFDPLIATGSRCRRLRQALGPMTGIRRIGAPTGPPWRI
jgi:hypothetical protein